MEGINREHEVKCTEGLKKCGEVCLPKNEITCTMLLNRKWQASQNLGVSEEFCLQA